MTTPSPRTRRLTRLGAALAIGAAAVVGLAWSQRPAPAAPPTAAPPRLLVAPGLIEAASDRVELGFEASGRIAELAVDEGDVVVAGQVLARLDDRIARARVARAAAMASTLAATSASSASGHGLLAPSASIAANLVPAPGLP